MRNLSSAFKDELNNDNRRYLEWVDITLKDGTVLNLREDSIWNNGIKVEDAVSGSSEFQIGSAIVNKATVTLNNIYDDFSDYIFDGATISVSIGLMVETEREQGDRNDDKMYSGLYPTETEKIHLFIGTVVEAPTTNSSILSLTCYDNMYKFDRDYSESNLSYPATRGQIIRDACNICGVQLQTVTFDNDDYVIQEKPSVEQLTFRQLISWVAQIGGQFCRCDSLGRLCIGWYDLKSYEIDTMKDGSYIPIKSYDNLSVNNEDVVITGVRVTEYRGGSTSEEDSVSFLYGKDGYVIDIKDNKLVFTGKGEKIATMIGERVVGMRFRPFSVSMMNNPEVEAGDICLITDRKGNQYKSLITSSTFQVGNKQSISCEAKSAARNSAKQYSLFSQAIVENRNNIKKEKKDRDKALEELANRINLSTGLFTTVEHNDGGGNVFYLHNKMLLKDSDIVWKMTAEAWAVSTDGGRTWNGGMTVDGDTIVRILDAVGIRANWITTGEFKVVDNDGNEVFYVNCDTGIVRIKAQEFSVTGQTIADISQKEIDKFVNGTYKNDLELLESSMKNKTGTWYQKDDPSKNWTGISEIILKDINGEPILDIDGNTIIIRYEKERRDHEGDLWKNPDTNDEFIYVDGEWIPMSIPDALFNTINGKASVFTVQPTPPYNVGDLWFTGNEILTCITNRTNGRFVNDDWRKNEAYTDDTGLKNFVNVEYANTVNKVDNLGDAIEQANALIKQNTKALMSLNDRDFRVEFKEITQAIDKTNGDLIAYKEELGNWMRFDKDGNLILGAKRTQGQDAYELKLTKNRISFMLNDSEVAYISNNELYITNSTVVQNLKIGRFIWEVRGNGNMGLVWR